MGHQHLAASLRSHDVTADGVGLGPRSKVSPPVQLLRMATAPVLGTVDTRHPTPFVTGAVDA